MHSIFADIRYGFRILRKNFGLSVVIILSIGLGIGVNTTIFSLLNALALRPLPGTQDPGQLVEVFTNYKGGMRFGAVSYPDYKDWRDRSQGLAGILAQDLVPVNLSRGERNEIVSGALVSGNFFSVLGVSPARGRLFSPDEVDDTPNSHPVVVISYELWQHHFGGDPDIVNRTITVNARSFTIVGVASKDFSGANVGLSVDLWAPMSMQPVLLPGADRLKARSIHWLDVVGRLKRGVSIGSASTALTSVANQLAAEFPDSNRGAGVTLVPTGQGPSDVQSVLLPVVELLMVVVFFILLIACSNVANLLLSRGTSREGEVAIRIAMGAPRKAIIRLLLTESILLAILAGIMATFLAYGSMRLLETFRPPTSVPLVLGLQIDFRVILFTLALSLVAGTLFGIIPAVRGARPELLPTLRSEGFFKMYRKSKLQNALVVLQIALSLFLLVGAGLILRSVQYVQRVDPGFEADHMMLASVDVGLSGYDPVRGANVYKQIIEKVRNLPGIRAASLAQAAPMEIETTHQIGLYVEGYDAPGHRALSMDFNVVTPGYFHAMGIGLISGRDFTDQDTADAPGIAIVNEAFAERYWPGQDPLGKKVSNQSAEGPFLQVVGVVKNSKYYSITERPFPFIYLPFGQRYGPSMVLHVRTAGDPSSYVASIEREVQSLDRAIPVYRVHTMKDQLGLSLIELRGAALFLEIFGAMALILAAVGLYGLMAYSVERRKSELAVRMALGAESKHVLTLIMKEGMVLTLVGIGIGLIAALASGRVLSSLLYGVSQADPLTIGVASLFLLVVAVLAIFIPARRATRTDPMDVLRSA